MVDKRYPSRVIREKCGGWSAMTEYRNWQRGFPKPEKIKLTINRSRQNIFTPLNFLNDLSKFIQEKITKIIEKKPKLL